MCVTDLQIKNGCLCCGEVGHVKGHCPFIGGTCGGCGKTGHHQNYCRTTNTKVITAKGTLTTGGGGGAGIFHGGLQAKAISAAAKKKTSAARDVTPEEIEEGARPKSLVFSTLLVGKAAGAAAQDSARRARAARSGRPVPPATKLVRPNFMVVKKGIELSIRNLGGEWATNYEVKSCSVAEDPVTRSHLVTIQFASPEQRVAFLDSPILPIASTDSGIYQTKAARGAQHKISLSRYGDDTEGEGRTVHIEINDLDDQYSFANTEACYYGCDRLLTTGSFPNLDWSKTSQAAAFAQLNPAANKLVPGIDYVLQEARVVTGDNGVGRKQSNRRIIVAIEFRSGVKIPSALSLCDYTVGSDQSAKSRLVLTITRDGGMTMEPHWVVVRTPAEAGCARHFAKSMPLVDYQEESIKESVLTGLGSVMRAPFVAAMSRMVRRIDGGVPLERRDVMQNLGSCLGSWGKLHNFDLDRFTAVLKKFLDNENNAAITAELRGGRAAPNPPTKPAETDPAEALVKEQVANTAEIAALEKDLKSGGEGGRGRPSSKADRELLTQLRQTGIRLADAIGTAQLLLHSSGSAAADTLPVSRPRGTTFSLENAPTASWYGDFEMYPGVTVTLDPAELSTCLSMLHELAGTQSRGWSQPKIAAFAHQALCDAILAEITARGIEDGATQLSGEAETSAKRYTGIIVRALTSDEHAGSDKLGTGRSMFLVKNAAMDGARFLKGIVGAMDEHAADHRHTAAAILAAADAGLVQLAEDNATAFTLIARPDSHLWTQIEYDDGVKALAAVLHTARKLHTAKASASEELGEDFTTKKIVAATAQMIVEGFSDKMQAPRWTEVTLLPIVRDGKKLTRLFEATVQKIKSANADAKAAAAEKEQLNAAEAKLKADAAAAAKQRLAAKAKAARKIVEDEEARLEVIAKAKREAQAAAVLLKSTVDAATLAGVAAEYPWSREPAEAPAWASSTTLVSTVTAGMTVTAGVLYGALKVVESADATDADDLMAKLAKDYGLTDTAAALVNAQKVISDHARAYEGITANAAKAIRALGAMPQKERRAILTKTCAELAGHSTRQRWELAMMQADVLARVAASIGMAVELLQTDEATEWSMALTEGQFAAVAVSKTRLRDHFKPRPPGTPTPTAVRKQYVAELAKLKAITDDELDTRIVADDDYVVELTGEAIRRFEEATRDATAVEMTLAAASISAGTVPEDESASRQTHADQGQSDVSAGQPRHHHHSRDAPHRERVPRALDGRGGQGHTVSIAGTGQTARDRGPSGSTIPNCRRKQRNWAPRRGDSAQDCGRRGARFAPPSPDRHLPADWPRKRSCRFHRLV